MTGSVIRHRGKIINSGIKVTSTNQGDTISSGGTLPGSGRTTRTGSAATKKGSKEFSRVTSHLGGLGGQSGSARETKSTSGITNPTRIKQIARLKQNQPSGTSRPRGGPKAVGGGLSFRPRRGGGYGPALRKGYFSGNAARPLVDIGKIGDKVGNFISRLTNR